MTHIVIVDDRVTNRRIWSQLARTLEDGIDVAAFADPVSALEGLKQRTPDLVITDFKMPVMDGAAFIRQLRGMPDCRDVPIIVVSVYEDRSYRYEALNAGATDFLMSPVDHFEFRARARNLLTLGRQQLLLKARAEDLTKALHTQTEQHQKALSENRERLLAVIDTVPAIVYATDKSGHCIFLNSYGARFAGAERQELVGKPLADIFGHAKAARDQENALKILKNTGVRDAVYEEAIDLPSGGRLTLLTRKTRLRDPGGGEAVLTVATDITDRKQMETALRRAKEASDLASRAKTEFLANMSHELRTPLNAILGFSEVMAMQQLGPVGTPRYLEYANDIHQSADHLLSIINDILDLARVEEGKLSLSAGVVELDQVMREATRMVAVDAKSKNLTLDVDIADGLPRLHGDSQRLRQVLLNLLVNAIKFTPAEGRVGAQALCSADGGVRVTVTDTGIGMTEQEIEVACTRFGQVFVSPESKRFSGVGLGLPLSVALVEMHGGRVEIASRPGNGTKVDVIFPEACRLTDAAENDAENLKKEGTNGG